MKAVAMLFAVLSTIALAFTVPLCAGDEGSVSVRLTSSLPHGFSAH
jgi:hypothetical protein